MMLLFQAGTDGLAMAIAAASLCILAVPALLGGVLGWYALRGRMPRAGAVVGGVLGAGLGFLAMVATFFEESFDPPPVITFDVPPGFAHDTVILLEDPTAPGIDWTAPDFIPFVSPTARLTVPRGGVLRVRELPYDSHTRMATGDTPWAVLPSPAPPGSLIVYVFGERESTLPLFGENPAGLAAIIRARESER